MRKKIQVTVTKSEKRNVTKSTKKIIENGVLNPKAHLRKKISIDDVMNSAVVASPLKLYDCCPFSDGASSVILCNEKFAKEHSKDYVKVIGSGRGGSPAALQGRCLLYTSPSPRDATLSRMPSSA